MSEATDPNIKERSTQINTFVDLFEAAFDELYETVINHINNPGKYVPPHNDYPVMSILDSGFPTFYDSGFYKNNSPRDYVGAIRPNNIMGLLAGYHHPNINFPKGKELSKFLQTNQIGERLNLKNPLFDGGITDWPVDRLVGSAVERYLHIYGLSAQIDSKRRSDILLPLVRGAKSKSLHLRLVIPIAMTHFKVDHFRLSDTAYIARIPKKMQLARARMSTLGSGAVKTVVGAATHAFVSNGWNLEVGRVDEVSKSLGQVSANVLDAIDIFFGSLRIATGISSGYAQVLWAPRNWALDYFCDLTPIYGTTLRQYPGYYDNYGWAGHGEIVESEKLIEVRRIYRCLLENKSEAMRLALRRLNGCLTRDDAADAIVDATIGLELILGDDQNQSLAYKLRLRAGALALLHKNPSLSAADVANKVKRIYSARSAIVHGLKKKSSKKASEPADLTNEADRKIGADLLRFVLDVLLTNPDYQESSRIDLGILLRGDSAESLKPQESKPRKPLRPRRRK